MIWYIGKCTEIDSHVTGDHAIRYAVKSCLYMVIVTYVGSRHSTMNLTTMNDLVDRRVYRDR